MKIFQRVFMAILDTLGSLEQGLGHFVEVPIIIGSLG